MLMYTVIGRLVVYGVFLVGVHQAFHHRSEMKSWLQIKSNGNPNDNSGLETAVRHIDAHNSKYRNWAFATSICMLIVFIEYSGGK